MFSIPFKYDVIFDVVVVVAILLRFGIILPSLDSVYMTAGSKLSNEGRMRVHGPAVNAISAVVVMG